MNIHEPAYRKAFELYLRRGIPIGLSLKAIAAENPTTHYIWRTRGDGKVRPSHAANEGKIFAWDNPPPTGYPGEDYNCRCWAEPYYGLVDLPNDPPIEPVYPELLIIPLLRTGRLISAWRTWALQNRVSREWKLGWHKSEIKWANRMEKGGWTPERITRTIRWGTPYKAPNRVNKPNTATRYEYKDDFVVVDDQLKEILQVSEPGYIPDKLIQ